MMFSTLPSVEKLEPILRLRGRVAFDRAWRFTTGGLRGTGRREDGTTRPPVGVGERNASVVDFWGLGDPKGEKRNEKSAVMRKVEKRRDVREEDVAMEKRPRFVETGPHGGTWFGETDAFVSFCPSDPHELERYNRAGVRLLSGGGRDSNEAVGSE